VVPPLHPLYNGPYAFTLQIGHREIIAVSCLKACTAVDATPGSPKCHSRPPGPDATAMPAAACPGGPAASKRVLISDPQVSPSQQEQPRIRPGTVFLLPRGEVCACPRPEAPLQTPQRRYPQRQQKPPMRIDL
jgi:hypothetical protein